MLFISINWTTYQNLRDKHDKNLTFSPTTLYIYLSCPKNSRFFMQVHAHAKNVNTEIGLCLAAIYT